MKRILNQKRYKTILTLAFIIAFVFTAFAGCDKPVDGTPTDTTPTATATPTPPPKVGLDAVFGKEQITIAAISSGSEEDSALFFEGAKAEAKSLGVTLNAKAAGDGFSAAVTNAADTADALIACVTGERPDFGALNAAYSKGMPITIFEMQQGSVASDISQIYFTPGGEINLAFDAALTYPPHDTPVRLILMFESKETESYILYKQLYGEGKIFPKEIYIASEAKTTAGEWLKSKLGGYIAGMLDGVYAENAALALEALDVIEALERTDMEVFCPGVTGKTVERMQKNPDVFAQTVGANSYLAGALSVRAALKGLKGEGKVTLELKPEVINASDIAANGAQALLSLNAEAATWNESWMDELRAYYAAAK